MILFGDSHAMQYFPPLEGIAKRDGWRLIALNKAECTPALVKVRGMIAADREYSRCGAWREGAEICPGGTCRAVIGDALTYRDDSHLSATFARTLRPWIERGLRRVGVAPGREGDDRVRPATAGYR